MDNPCLASVLAVGTEITTGQITNRNAAWISEKLSHLGVQVVLHETVPDDRPLIRQALDRCAALTQMVFVTGGLGPTTDDFTREVIADWAGQPLEFNDSSWQQITERLTRFGIRVAESNRQQCYYPAGAQVIFNSKGTANGFRLEKDGRMVWVFPGPPREVEAVWDSGKIENWIRERYPVVRPLRLLRWHCLGKSEAELGELTEQALASSGLQIGYRAHRPFVEVKVWCPEEMIEKHAEHLRRLEEAIGPWVVARNEEDLAHELLREFSPDESVEILDAGTTGAISERLIPILRRPEFRGAAESLVIATEWASPASAEAWMDTVLNQADPEVITLAIAGPTPEGAYRIGFREGTRVCQDTIISPYRNPELRDRTLGYVTEMTIKRWAEWLRDSTPN